MKDKKKRTMILTFQYLRIASSNSFETSEYVYFMFKNTLNSNEQNV